MLQKLNQRFQGVFAWVIITLIAVTFAMFGIEYYVQSRHATPLKADVNGQPITAGDFDLYYRRNQQPDEQGTMTSLEEARLKQETLNKMILNSLGLQSATLSGFAVMQPQVISAIQNIAQFQQDGRFSREKYQQLLSHAFFTPSTFQTELKQEILLNQQRFALGGTEFVLPSELKNFIELSLQSRNYDYMVIPYKPFLQSSKIEDKDVTDYYQKNQKDFTVPEKVKVEYVRLSMKDIREKAHLNEKQIKHYYDENKGNYTKPARWHVAHIFFAFPKGASLDEQKRIKEKAEQVYNTLKISPDKFEHFVKTTSDDKLSVIDGGVLPWIVAGQSEYDNALVDLTVAGQVSAPVKTSQGYDILKLIAYTPLQLKPFDSVKQAIKEQLLLDQVQSEYSQALEQLADLTYQTPDSLEPVADALHLKIEQEEPFSREGGASEVAKNPRVIQAVFSPEVFKQGNNSEPVQLEGDAVAVLRVSKHIPAFLQPLSEVKPVIVALLAKQQAELAAKQLGDTLLSLQHQESAQTALIEKNHLKWQHAVKEIRKAEHVSQFVNQIAFELSKAGEALGKSTDNGDFVIVKLGSITNGELDSLSPEQRTSITLKIQEMLGSMDYNLYMNSVLRNSKIVRY